MNDKAKIRLKENFENPRSVTVGTKTIQAKPGEIVTVPIADAQMWINTGKFEWASDPPPPPDSDLPENIPGRAALVKAGLSLDEVRVMDKNALVALDGIGRNYADQILTYFQKQDEESDGGES